MRGTAACRWSTSGSDGLRVTDDDATIRLPPPRAAAGGVAVHRAPPSRPGLRLAAAGGALLLVAALGGGGWMWLGRPAPQEPPPKPETPATAALAPPAAAIPRPPAPEIGPPLASAREILAHRGEAPAIFRLDANPSVFVIDFPTLDYQGATLNRVAALLEKVGQPRDRVLDDAGLARAIAASGDTAATYYYGHNYRGRDLERFFRLAERDGIALTPQEAWLRDELPRLRRLVPPQEDFALISVPAADGRSVDAAMREAILRHEIGHGHYFTNPHFAAHVARVWREVFTPSERAGFRAFLQREGYDPALEEVMMNETMAYLLFTPDPRFFRPAFAGLTDARARELTEALRVGAPR